MRHVIKCTAYVKQEKARDVHVPFLLRVLDPLREGVHHIFRPCCRSVSPALAGEHHLLPYQVKGSSQEYLIHDLAHRVEYADASVYYKVLGVVPPLAYIVGTCVTALARV